MNQIFVIYPEAYTDCAEQLMNGLTDAGYPLWENWDDIQLENSLYSQILRRGIMGSDVVILLWGKESIGSDSESIEWQLLVAQQLKKTIFPIQLDDERLPNTLVNIDVIKAEPDCTNIVESLESRFPAANDVDKLAGVLSKLAHKYIRERRAGIEQVDQILEKSDESNHEHEEQLLAALEMIVVHDPIGNMRRLAQSVLDKNIRSHPRSSFSPEESRHMIGVRCINKHVTWYDKREICPASGKIKRMSIQRAGQPLDELSLECDYCDETTVVSIDCEGYK